MNSPDPYLLLAAAEGGEPGLVAALLAADANPETLLRQPPDGLPAAVRRRLADADLAATARSWCRAAASIGCAVLTPNSPDYPARLRDAPLRPLVLFTRGDRSVLRATTCNATVVGSRTPSAYGLAAATDFCDCLARAGVPLWSGLAHGIDAAAHRACVDHGVPTVAVLAGGLDLIYPAAHRGLADSILAGGGLWLSELPPGRRPRRGHFPRRNRILALATDLVLVIEAGMASGSLHTARFAAEGSTPVYALPGPYTSERSRGCHALLRDGAAIAWDPADLLRDLGVEQSRRQPTKPATPTKQLLCSADETAILSQLSEGPRPTDLVQNESRLDPTEFLRTLLRLVERGEVLQLPGDLLARTKAGTGTRAAP